MYMKNQTQLLILAVVLFLVVLVTSIFSCCNFKPYMANDVFKTYSKVEGMENQPVLSQVGYSDPDSLGQTAGKLGEETEIDMYSKLPTKDDSSESSGLTKSGGSLSLDDKTKNMLKTRGMNAV